MSTRKVYYRAARGEFLDVHEVGSSVMYRVSVERRSHGLTFSADIELRDCEDMIRWSGYGHDGAKHLTNKLDKAIRLLEAAKASVKRAATEYGKHTRRRRRK